MNVSVFRWHCIDLNCVFNPSSHSSDAMNFKYDLCTWLQRPNANVTWRLLWLIECSAINGYLIQVRVPFGLDFCSTSFLCSSLFGRLFVDSIAELSVEWEAIHEIMPICLHRSQTHDELSWNYFYNSTLFGLFSNARRKNVLF